ncbi:hypothetical protein [Bordetella genomosp. 13]|uniref:hypothetical protein n=1 Tax=Bordetella genomosp. 13 TaxID=463040 RepID=UPI0011A7DCCC|nr:hypothetical protein [Bordetella genomosp. 13]
MRTLSQDEFSLKPLPASQDQVRQSRVVIDGKVTQAVVDGVVLEAALQWRQGYLVFATDDIPFEEMLRITLLDADLRVVDSARIGGMYTTGVFSSMKLEGADTVRFRFLGGTDWRVKILPAPGFRVPFLSEPRGVARPLGFSRRFVVTGNPQPESR